MANDDTKICIIAWFLTITQVAMLNETRMLHSRSGPGEWGRDRIQGLAGVDISLWGPEVDVPADSRATPARNWLIPRVQNTRIEGHRKHCPWTLSVIHCRARTSDQPQSSRRTRFDHTLKWEGIPSDTGQPIAGDNARAAKPESELQPT